MLKVVMGMIGTATHQNTPGEVVAAPFRAQVGSGGIETAAHPTGRRIQCRRDPACGPNVRLANPGGVKFQNGQADEGQVEGVDGAGRLHRGLQGVPKGPISVRHFHRRQHPTGTDLLFQVTTCDGESQRPPHAFSNLTAPFNTRTRIAVTWPCRSPSRCSGVGASQRTVTSWPCAVWTCGWSRWVPRSTRNISPIS
ncbi:hypothetical protein DEFR109230_19025 [Deinococcus frigens]